MAESACICRREESQAQPRSRLPPTYLNPTDGQHHPRVGRLIAHTGGTSGRPGGRQLEIPGVEPWWLAKCNRDGPATRLQGRGSAAGCGRMSDGHGRGRTRRDRDQEGPARRSWGREAGARAAHPRRRGDGDKVRARDSDIPRDAATRMRREAPSPEHCPVMRLGWRGALYEPLSSESSEAGRGADDSEARGVTSTGAGSIIRLQGRFPALATGPVTDHPAWLGRHF